jgi:putative transposase
MRKSFKYRIYPTKRQARILREQFELCRWVYNETLRLKQDIYKEHKINLSLYDLNKKLTEWKTQKPELKQVHSQVLQKVQERVDLAFKAFFRRLKTGENPGFPRFKGENRLKSICFKQCGFKFQDNGRLKISKTGDIKVNLHRKIQGKVNTCTIIKEPTGKFFVVFSCETEILQLPLTNKQIGCDLGVKTLLTCSDNSTIENPKFLKKDQKALQKASKKRSKAKEEQNWAEYRRHGKVAARIHERVKNRRENFACQTANKLTNKYDLICFENLDINGMNSFSPINSSIRDAAWRLLIQKTQFKAESAGKKVVLVKPEYTSKTCSRCGIVHEDFDLKQEFMSCSCGNDMQRDLNASINILRLGLESLVQA